MHDRRFGVILSQAEGREWLVEFVAGKIVILAALQVVIDFRGVKY
jgi:hypothetical protein